jgi:hypothetical protein
MPIGVWLCIAFFIVLSTASLVWLFRAGLGLWRTFRSFGERLDGAVGDMTARSERHAAATAALGIDLPRLEAAMERLRVTLARTAVLRAAVRDVQDSVAAVTAFYPRK